MELLFGKLGRTKKLIILVHGLQGSNATWKSNDKINGLAPMLSKVEEIYTHYDCVTFDYYSKLLGAATKIRANLSKYIPTLAPGDGFNISISRISRLLKSQIEIISDAHNYEDITLISHSMGGLVSKSTILDLLNNSNNLIKTYISIAVPHNGSNLASGFEFMQNIFIKELAPGSEFLTNLSNKWDEAIDNNLELPYTHYYHAEFDTLVFENSAIPTDKRSKDKFKCFYVPRNHYDVKNPSSEIDIFFISIKNRLIKNAINNQHTITTTTKSRNTPDLILDFFLNVHDKYSDDQYIFNKYINVYSIFLANKWHKTNKYKLLSENFSSLISANFSKSENEIINELSLIEQSL